MRNHIRVVAAFVVIVSSISCTALPAQAAATAERRTFTDSPALATPIDWAIDAMVDMRRESQQISQAGVPVAREQLRMQFRALSAERKKEILDATARVANAADVWRLQMLLQAGVKEDAEQALAKSAAAANSRPEAMRPLDAGTPGGPVPLGGADADLVFVALPGPCRIYDSRNGPGTFAPFESRQVFTVATGPGYPWSGDQGGSGFSSSGNCIGSEFTGGTLPRNVVATVTIVAPTTGGALRAWNGGPTLSTGAIHAWNAGDSISNTSVIAMDRTLAAFPNSGSKRDIGINNNSGGNVHVVIDVAGYFIQNTATALDCTFVNGSPIVILSFGGLTLNAPSCPAGYTRAGVTHFASGTEVVLYQTTPSSCFFYNTGAQNRTIACGSNCCRIPGR